MKRIRHILVHASWSGPSKAAKAAAEKAAHAAGVQLDIIPTELARESLESFGLVESDFHGWAEAFRIENGQIAFRGPLGSVKGPILSSIAEFIGNET